MCALIRRNGGGYWLLSVEVMNFSLTFVIWFVAVLHPLQCCGILLTFHPHFLLQLGIRCDKTQARLTVWVWAKEQPKQGNCSATTAGTCRKCCDIPPMRENPVFMSNFVARMEGIRHIYMYSGRILIYQYICITKSSPSHSLFLTAIYLCLGFGRVCLHVSEKTIMASLPLFIFLLEQPGVAHICAINQHRRHIILTNIIHKNPT